MSKENNYADNSRDSVKAINEFMLDLVGALVPGVIFLFSVIICIIVPMIMLYIPSLSQGNGENRADLFISNIFQGWFWLVIFFTFLILAFAIGNIFYRLDIKKIDKKSFGYEKKGQYKNRILQIFEDIIKKDNEAKKNAFFERYFELIYNHLPEKDRESLYEKTDEKLEIIEEERKKAWKKLKPEKPDFSWLNTIAYNLYKDKKEPVLKDKEIRGDFQQAVEEEQLELLKKVLKPQNKFLSSKGDINSLIAIGWYFLFYLRSEVACDNETDCQFPYEYYNTYLIKRNETHLLEHVGWCYDESSRSKNALNKLKLKIQLIAHRDYNILVKNEAHIRMSSSSWYVSKTNMLMSVISLILIFFVIIINNNSCCYMNWSKLTDIKNIIILFLPVLIFLFNIFIYRSVIKFLHYQRLREIFFVLQVYDEYFGENCANRDKRKNDISFSAK
jgi:hypothetical protein